MSETRESNLLTIAQVARRLNVSRPTVYRRIWEGQLPALRIGGQVGPLRVDERELEQWLYADDVDAGAARRLHPVSATASAVGRRAIAAPWRLRRQRQRGDPPMTPRVATKPGTETRNVGDRELRRWFWGAMPQTNHSHPSISVRVGSADKKPIHEQRDLSKLTAGAGGNVVATTFAERLYEHVVETSGVRRTGAVVFTTEGGQTLLVPKTSAQSSAALVAEAGTISESDPAFGQASLGAFGYKLLVQVSQELEQDTEVDLLGYLARQAGRAIGLASGAHYVTGTGTGQPEGVQTNSTVGAQAPTGNTTSVHPDTLIAVFHSVPSGYREQAVWLMNDLTKLKVAQLKEATTNQYLWRPGLEAGAPDLLLGRPIVTDVAMPAVTASSKPILFGDFSAGYAIRDVAEVRFERSEGIAFGSGLVTFRAVLRTDGRPVDGLAIRAYQASAT